MKPITYMEPYFSSFQLALLIAHHLFGEFRRDSGIFQPTAQRLILLFLRFFFVHPQLGRYSAHDNKDSAGKSSSN